MSGAGAEFIAEYWSYPPIGWEGGPDKVADTGRLGEGVLGPLEEAAEVNEECDSPLELVDDAIELTRGDEVPEEYAKGGG